MFGTLPVIHDDFFFYANVYTYDYLFSVFTRFNDSCDSIWRSNTHLICPNKFLTGFAKSSWVKTELLIGSGEGDKELNNTSTFPSLLFSEPDETSLIITQSTAVDTIPYITSSCKPAVS